MVRSFGFNPLQTTRSKINHISKAVIRRHFQKIALIRFPQSERFKQFCQGELSFSFAKVNCDARQHFSRLFLFSRAINIFSFPCCYVIKELVHDLAVHLSSYGCTWEVWRALRKLGCYWLSPRATLTLPSCSPNFPRAYTTR